MATTMNSSSASSSSTTSSEVTSVKLNIPPSLVFLISNIHSFVTIKLDSHNYVLWRTQIEHALKANSFFGYVDGTISCPSATVVRTTEITVSEPDMALWKIVDSQLVSCLIATLSPSTLSLILGLDHAFQIWEVLEHRFNSVSRTHIHDLKRQLYNVTKTSTLEVYFYTIKQLAYKSAAAGAPVSEEDLIFYTMHGLPTEFDNIQTALSARVGNITFEELVTILNGEEMRRNRSSNVNVNTSVFVATPRATTSGLHAVKFPQQQQGASSSITQFPQQQINFGGSQHAESQQQPPSMFVAPYPQQYNSYKSNNKPKGFRNQRSGSRPACQICDKTNHTAKDCYHRLNLQYQPMPYNTNFSPQAHILQYHNPSAQPTAPLGANNQGQVPQNFSAGLLPTPPQPPQAYFAPTLTSQYSSSTSSCPPYNPSYPMNYPTVSAPSYSSPVSGPSGNWFLDSGATNHVTNELSNLSLHQPYNGNTEVIVGNGQNNQPDFTSRTFSSGTVSNSALY